MLSYTLVLLFGNLENYKIISFSHLQKNEKDKLKFYFPKFLSQKKKNLAFCCSGNDFNKFIIDNVIFIKFFKNKLSAKRRRRNVSKLDS